MLKETKEFLALGFGLANASGAALADDGKVDWKDIPKYAPVLGDLASGVVGIDQIPTELKGLDEAQYQELVDWAKAEFDIPQDEVEEKVELAFQVGLNLALLVVSFRKDKEA